MTVRTIIACDSDPAEYARGGVGAQHCRAWRTVVHLLDAVTDGWTTDAQGRDRCPACTRALAHHRARAAEPPQEPPS